MVKRLPLTPGLKWNQDETDKTITAAHYAFSDLYECYHSQIITQWNKLSELERAKLFFDHCKNGFGEDPVLDKAGTWRSTVLPELTLSNVSTNPNWLLDQFKHRATISLPDQFKKGVDEGPGDAAFIILLVKKGELELENRCPNDYFLFGPQWYGSIFAANASDAVSLKTIEKWIDAGECLPHSLGIQIFLRQYWSLLECRALSVKILQSCPRRLWNNKQWKRIQQEEASIIEVLLDINDIRKTPVFEHLPYVRDRADAFHEQLIMLRHEPIVLVHHVNAWLLSRPGLVMDDKGRRAQLQTDKDISGAVFDVVRDTMQRFTTWDYIYCLLIHLENDTNRTVSRRLVLQELSNVCHLEYNRAQAHFIRHVQTGIGAGYFKRLGKVYDEAYNQKVSMKVKPEEMSKDEPHLKYVLCLCQSHNTASQAREWIAKLNELYESSPSLREKLQEREVDALADLIYITTLIYELSKALSLPPLSHKTGQLFTAGCLELHSGLNEIRKEVDLLDFSVPVNKLLEPGIAIMALTKLDSFIFRKLGSRLQFYYQYVVSRSLAYFYTQYQEVTKTPGMVVKVYCPVTSAFAIANGIGRVKHEVIGSCLPKSNLPQVSTSRIEPARKALGTICAGRMYFDSLEKEVLLALFRYPEGRTSIAWEAFENAMFLKGFAVMRIGHRVYTFYPPIDLPERRVLTVYQPRNSKIEGLSILILARRLMKAYGEYIKIPTLK